jgi:hypothetical protein
MLVIAQYLTDSVRQFIDKLFKRFRLSPPPPLPEVCKEKTPSKPRKHNKDKAETFSDLLDNLEHTFNLVKLPTMKESWLEKDSIVGLKKLGIHVPNPWNSDLDQENTKVDLTMPLPAIMCISTAMASTVNTKNNFYLKMCFAVKIKKLPWHVAHSSGTPYQYGVAFDLNGKLFWVHMYMTVSRSTGEIFFCDELNLTKHRIDRSKSFTTKAWSGPKYFEDGERSAEELKKINKNLFIAMHKWWVERETRWNVIVKKNGERITFGVDNKQTPYYFKDRDKSIKTESGQTKKIVHYVKQHERKVSDKTTVVMEHIRGLQEFSWSGYQCKVVSPKLQSKTSATFIESANHETGDPSNVVYLSKVGSMLAKAEETSESREPRKQKGSK